MSEAPIIGTELPTPQADEVRALIDSLAQRARPLTSREFLCEVPDAASRPADGSEFTPVIACLNRYDAERPAKSVVPVSVIAIVAPTRRGHELVLKNRTKWNSREDFSTLSLVSERVLEEDLEEAAVPPLSPDDSRALDELWLRLGRPQPFIIPEEAFRHAAQRELFMSCGLDIAADRLQLRGTCLLDRESEDEYIGFYVYVLELQRSPGPDELSHALAWNSDLEPVALNQLYAPKFAPRLNRLLRRRESWLRDIVFALDGAS